MGSVENIARWRHRAIKLGLLHEIDWYRRGSNRIKEMAERWEIPFDVAVAVVAVISPAISWECNLLGAERLFEAYREGRSTVRVPGYRRNIEKARRILETGDISLVSGPKVTAFFHNLLDPDDPYHVTIDRHSIRVWRGESGQGHASISNKEWKQAAEDYRSAAARYKLLPNQLQALTWVAYKEGY